MNILKYVLLIAMTILGAFGAFFLKRASMSKTAKELLKNYNFYLGGFLYFMSALINIYLFKFIQYSVLIPLTALAYVWSLILAGVLLKEKITFWQIVGMTLIIIGVVLVAL